MNDEDQFHARAGAFVRSPHFCGGMPKALWLQDDNDSIKLLSGIARR